MCCIPISYIFLSCGQWELVKYEYFFADYLKKLRSLWIFWKIKGYIPKFIKIKGGNGKTCGQEWSLCNTLFCLLCSQGYFFGILLLDSSISIVSIRRMPKALAPKSTPIQILSARHNLLLRNRFPFWPLGALGVPCWPWSCCQVRGDRRSTHSPSALLMQGGGGKYCDLRGPILHCTMLHKMSQYWMTSHSIAHKNVLSQGIKKNGEGAATANSRDGLKTF